MGLILRTSSLANSGNSISIKGSALSYQEGDGNFMYLLTNMSGSNISITGSTGIIGNLTISGSLFLEGLTLSSGVNMLMYNSQSGQFFYQPTNSITIGTASFVTSSNVYGPYGANSILSASYASSSFSSISSSYSSNSSLASTASYVTSSNVHGPFGIDSILSASYASGSTSSSFALTSSVSLNSVVTASAANNIITFTKGNGSTFNITVDTGSITGFVTTASFNAYTSSINSYTSSINAFSASILNFTSSTNTSISNLNISASNALITASVINNNTVRFRKGDGSQFDVTIDTGSANLSGYATTSSLNAYTASINTFTSSVNSSISNILNHTSSINNFSASINSYTSSINAYTSSINAFSASILNFTSSTNTSISNLNTSASNALITASASNNIITFKKGNGSTFNVVIDTGSIDLGGYTLTSSFNSYTSSINLFSASILNFTSSVNTSISNLNTSASNALITASIVNGNTIRFRKGNGSQFDVTVDTGSANLSGVVTTSSFNAYTASINSYSSSINSYTASLNNFSASLLSFTSSISSSVLALQTSASNALITASAINNNITFTKGNGSTFSVAVNTGSLGGVVTTSSFNSYTSSINNHITSINLFSASISSSVTTLQASASSALVDASMTSGNSIGFIRGNGDQFTLTVDTGSGGGPISVTGSILYSNNPTSTSPDPSTSDYSIFLGLNAGRDVINAYSSHFIGQGAGDGATDAYSSQFIGSSAGEGAINANLSQFIGDNAGFNAVSASCSTLIGFQAGYNSNPFGIGIKSNNIIIGTNITLPDGTQDSINIGGIIFGTGSYNGLLTSTYSGSAGGRIGVNVVFPTHNFEVSGTVSFPNLTQQSQNNVVLIDTATGRLFYTASSAIGGGGGNVDLGAYTTTASFNSYTSSINLFSASINSYTSSINAYTSSINAFSASILNFTSSTNSSISALQTSASNALITASASGNIITFRKGNGTTFTVPVTQALTQTTTGTSASLILSSSGAITASLSDGLVWIISNDSANNNGNTFIWSSGSQQWYVIPRLDTVAGDARYLQLTGGTMVGNITMSPGFTLIGTASWAVSSSNAVNSINAITSSYPFSVSGSTIYSTHQSTTNFSTSNGVFVGFRAGSGSIRGNESNFIGYEAGFVATNASSSNFIGYQAGYSGSNASNSNFIGNGAGYQSANSPFSNFIGYYAGRGTTAASYSVFLGYQAGYSPNANIPGSNNIIIGTNITLDNQRRDSINIGGIIFGTGSYSTTTGNPFSGSSGGRMGVNIPIPLYNFHVSGTVAFQNLITSSTTIGNVVMIDNNGQLFVTSSSAIGGGNVTVPTVKAGSGSIASFGGSPLSSSIVFGTAFSNNSYAVTVTGEDARVWSIQNKTSNSFVINSNSTVPLTGPVYWIATPFN